MISDVKLIDFSQNDDGSFSFVFDINNSSLIFKYTLKPKIKNMSKFLNDIIFKNFSNTTSKVITNNSKSFLEYFDVDIDNNLYGSYFDDVKKMFDINADATKQYILDHFFKSDIFKMIFFNLKMLSIIIEKKEIKI